MSSGAEKEKAGVRGDDNGTRSRRGVERDEGTERREMW